MEPNHSNTEYDLLIPDIWSLRNLRLRKAVIRYPQLNLTSTLTIKKSTTLTRWDVRNSVTGLVHTNIAIITEHHLVGFLRVRWATHVADDVFVVLDAKTFFAFHDCLDFIPTSNLLVEWKMILIPNSDANRAAGDLTSSSSTTLSNCSSVTGTSPARFRSPLKTFNHASSHWSRS